MADESPRIQDLRRRVQADPASIAFAQLAEECRRSGDAAGAVQICRTGLARHPGYLSARVTLGRALIELGRLDEAAVELQKVVEAAPNNLAAVRGLAEIHQQRGEMPQALAHYQRVMQLAQADPEPEQSVPQAPSIPLTPAKVEQLFDFDSLLKQLGETGPLPVSASPVGPASFAISPIQAVNLEGQAADALATVESDLRHRAEQRAAEERSARAQLAMRRQAAVVADLEAWLNAIVADRPSPGLV